MTPVCLVVTENKVAPEGVHPKTNASKENGLICEDSTAVDDWMENFRIVFAEDTLPDGQAFHVKRIGRRSNAHLQVGQDRFEIYK